MEVNMAYFFAGLLIKVNVIFQLEHFPSRDDNHITWYDAWLDQQQEIINSNHKVIDWTPPTYFFFQVYQRQTLSEETSSLRRMAFARNASFRNSLPRPIYIINSDLIPGGIDAALKFL